VATFEKSVMARLVRVESKLVRGFEELGVNIDQEDDWLIVDDNNNYVHISTLGRSIIVILTEMARNGATKEGHEYELIHNGEMIGTVIYNKVFK
jgi:hypothetical protein